MTQRPDALYGLSIKHIAQVCRVSEKTAGRWKSGTTCPPYSALVLLVGDLGAFSTYWRGWTVRGEQIVSPEQWTVSRNDALSVPLLRQQVKILEAELRKIQGIRDALEDQPMIDAGAVSIR